MIEGFAIIGLVAGFPVGLFGLVVALDRFETSFVQPDERAAALVELVSSNRGPDEVELVAAQLLAPVVPGVESEQRVS